MPEEATTPPVNASRWGWLIAAASVLLTLALLEVPTLFGFDYREPLGTPADFADGRGVMFDPELLFITRPNRHIVGHRHGDIAMAWQLQGPGLSEIDFDVVIDQNGFRNPPGLTHADIAALGDSFIIGGGGTSEAGLVTNLLAQKLGVSVVNLGQPAYGPQQELAVLRRYAGPYHPSTVLWAFYEGNDLADALAYEPLREVWPHPLDAAHVFWNRAFLTNAARAVTRLLRAPVESPLASKRSGTLRDGQRMWFPQSMEALADGDLRGIELTRRTLVNAYEWCADRGARLVVVFIPNKFRVYGDLCTFPPDSECHRWRPNQLPEYLKAVASSVSKDVGYIDLTPGFLERARAGAMLYYPDDSHWNDAGNHAAAEILAEMLRQTSAQR